MTLRIPFCVQSYKLDTLPVSAQRCVNLIPESAPPDAKTQVYLFSRPGLSLFKALAGNVIRGVIEFIDGYIIVVIDQDVYKVDANANSTLLGAVDGYDPVTMAHNGSQCVICTGTGLAFVATTSTVTQITDPDFPQVSTVDYIDGYHVFTVKDSEQIVISEILDATSYDALDFASAEANPDKLVRVIVDHREIWLFGTKTTELRVNTGAEFPFERQDGAYLERGCAAALSVAKMDNSVFWLGDDNVVYRLQGYQPVRVSTHAIERAIRKFGNVSDAFAWTYTQDGHSYYVLTFPTGDWTIVYDAATSLWHERKSGMADTTRWNVNGGIKAFNKIIVASSDSGKLFYLDPETYSDDGDAFQRVATSSPVGVSNVDTEMGTFELMMDTGRGLATGQGSNPIVWMSWSDDGGHTFSNEYSRSVGRIGEYRKRVRWNRGGQFRTRVYRLTYSEPTPFGIIEAYGDAEALAA